MTHAMWPMLYLHILAGLAMTASCLAGAITAAARVRNAVTSMSCTAYFARPLLIRKLSPCVFGVFDADHRTDCWS